LNKPCPQAFNGQPQNDAQQPADTRIEKLFLELGGIYGYLWKSMHKTVAEWAAAKHEWANELFQKNNYASDEIEYAKACVKELKTKDGQYRTPTLPEFADFAKQKRRRNLEDRIRENQEKIIKLTKKPVDPMLVEAAKKEWQKFIKRKNINPHA
jgi:hypothetical protein